MTNTVRIVPIEEVANAEWYVDMAELAIIFNHEVIEDKHGTWRWKENALTDLIYDHCPSQTPSYRDLPEYPTAQKRDHVRSCLDLNELWRDLHRGLFTIEEMMKFYMQMGYSLSGFGEVFGYKEASDWKLDGALTSEDEDEGGESIIDYMRRVHAGKVLKI